MMRFPSLLARLARFRRDEDGSYTVETLLALPLLIWGMIGSLTYIDAYRTQTMNLRITYSIADQVSRLEKPMEASFVDGLGRIYEHLAPPGTDTYLRITSVIWHETDQKWLIQWSDTTTASTEASPPCISDTNFHLIEDQIPILADGDSVLVVETWLDYSPPFSVGIEPRRFDNDVVVSPRWTKIEHQNPDCAP